MTPELIEGLRLMLVGMTTVFAFLGVLVVAMHALRRVVDALGYPLEESTSAPLRPAQADDAEIVAAVIAAVAAFRAAQEERP